MSLEANYFSLICSFYKQKKDDRTGYVDDAQSQKQIYDTKSKLLLYSYNFISREKYYPTRQIKNLLLYSYNFISREKYYPTGQIVHLSDPI